VLIPVQRNIDVRHCQAVRDNSRRECPSPQNCRPIGNGTHVHLNFIEEISIVEEAVLLAWPTNYNGPKNVEVILFVRHVVKMLLRHTCIGLTGRSTNGHGEHKGILVAGQFKSHRDSGGATPTKGVIRNITAAILLGALHLFPYI